MIRNVSLSISSVITKKSVSIWSHALEKSCYWDKLDELLTIPLYTAWIPQVMLSKECLLLSA